MIRVTTPILRSVTRWWMMSAQYTESDLQFLSYKAVISRARHALEWLLNVLAIDK
jgi:hypothetical protein